MSKHRRNFSFLSGVLGPLVLLGSVILLGLLLLFGPRVLFGPVALLSRDRARAASPPLVAAGGEIADFLTRLSGFGYRGAMLVVRDGAVVLREGYGLAREDEKAPNTPGTLFDVGSFAKTFTAAAVLQLEEAGRLKVDDAISRHLDGVPEDKAGVTIQQLLTHTAGIADDFGTYEDIGRAAALERILRLPLRFPPGTDGEYSNGGYVLLAAIVEAAAGVPYRDYVRRHIFESAGMHDTGFWGKLAPPVARARIACGYDEMGPVGDPVAWSDSTWFDLGGGMVLSTVDDLRAWVAALEAGTVLSRASVDRMFTPAGKETPRGRYSYGWFIDTASPHGMLIHHGGDSVGFGADVAWYRDARVLVVSLCNVRHDWFPTHIRADRVVRKILFGEPYTMPPVFVGASSDSSGGVLTGGSLQEETAGSYRLPSGGTFVIRQFRGQLQIGARGQDAVAVLAGADKAQEATWTEQSACLQRAFDGLVRGEFAPFDSTAGPGGRDFREAVLQEIKTLGGGQVSRIEVVGTSPAGYPPGALSTLLHLEYEGGKVVPYRVSAINGTIMATSDRCADLCALTPLQVQREGLLAGWDLVAEKGILVAVRKEGGHVAEIGLFRDNLRWSARRVESSGRSPAASSSSRR